MNWVQHSVHVRILFDLWLNSISTTFSFVIVALYFLRLFQCNVLLFADKGNYFLFVVFCCCCRWFVLFAQFRLFFKSNAYLSNTDVIFPFIIDSVSSISAIVPYQAMAMSSTRNKNWIKTNFFKFEYFTWITSSKTIFFPVKLWNSFHFFSFGGFFFRRSLIYLFLFLIILVLHKYFIFSSGFYVVHFLCKSVEIVDLQWCCLVRTFLCCCWKMTNKQTKKKISWMVTQNSDTRHWENILYRFE